MKTLKQLAQEALDVQDACNLTAIVHGWARAIPELRTRLEEAGHPSGTEDINRHPINVMWADKCSHLTGGQFADPSYFSKAFDACEALAKEGS